MIGESTEDWESRDREGNRKEGKSTKERGLIKAERKAGTRRSRRQRDEQRKRRKFSREAGGKEESRRAGVQGHRRAGEQDNVQGSGINNISLDLL